MKPLQNLVTSAPTHSSACLFIWVVLSALSRKRQSEGERELHISLSGFGDGGDDTHQKLRMPSEVKKRKSVKKGVTQA